MSPVLHEISSDQDACYFVVEENLLQNKVCLRPHSETSVFTSARNPFTGFGLGPAPPVGAGWRRHWLGSWLDGVRLGDQSHFETPGLPTKNLFRSPWQRQRSSGLFYPLSVPHGDYKGPEGTPAFPGVRVVGLVRGGHVGRVPLHECKVLQTFYSYGIFCFFPTPLRRPVSYDFVILSVRYRPGHGLTFPVTRLPVVPQQVTVFDLLPVFDSLTSLHLSPSTVDMAPVSSLIEVRTLLCVIS